MELISQWNGGAMFSRDKQSPCIGIHDHAVTTFAASKIFDHAAEMKLRSLNSYIARIQRQFNFWISVLWHDMALMQVSRSIRYPLEFQNQMRLSSACQLYYTASCINSTRCTTCAWSICCSIDSRTGIWMRSVVSSTAKCAEQVHGKRRWQKGTRTKLLNLAPASSRSMHAVNSEDRGNAPYGYTVFHSIQSRFQIFCLLFRSYVQSMCKQRKPSSRS